MALHKLCLAALGLGLAVATTGSASTVVFDSIGSGTAFTSGGAWFGPALSAGAGFVSSGSGALEKIEMSLKLLNGAKPAAYTISLYSNGAGNIPGTSLWSQTYTYTDHPVTGDAQGTTFDIVRGPTLTAGETYWVTGSMSDTGGADDKLGWRSLVGVDVPGLCAYNNNDGWATQGTTDAVWGVRVTAVPEPTCLALIGVTSGLLMSRRRRAV